MTDDSRPYYRPIEIQRDRLPAWVLLLAALLVAGAGLYFVTNLSPVSQNGTAGQPGGPAAPEEPGATGSAPPGGAPVDADAAMALIEDAGCTACHGPDLEGAGNFPPLTGVADGPVSDNLQELGQAHPDDWANLWIAGDAPEVQGIDRRGMPAFADELSPEDIDLIVEYLKSL